MDQKIYGRNPVLEAIASGVQIDRILILKNIEGAGRKIFTQAKRVGIPVQGVDRKALDRAADGGAHQGVIAYLSEFSYKTVDDIFMIAEARSQQPFIVVLDGVEDPHNLGAIIRSAEAAGVHGVIIPKNRAVAVNSSAIKASAGAAMHMAVARVPGIPSVIDDLKKRGVWIYGLDMAGENYSRISFDGSMALIAGAEGKGLSHLVREKCDFLVSIPMRGKVDSLNVSAASAIVLFAMAQRDE